MKFNHLVKYNGKYYPAGSDVPVGEPPVSEDKPRYSKTDINRMSTAQLQQLAGEQGIDGAEGITGAELKKVLIEKFGL